jgi:hypothetical protein
MPQILEVTLLLAVIVALLGEVVIVLVLLRALAFLKSLTEPEKHTCCQPQVWSSSNVIAPAAPHDQSLIVKLDKPVEKALFRCEHCGKGVNSAPVRQIIGDEGNFLVYNCESCGQETANPAND